MLSGDIMLLSRFAALVGNKFEMSGTGAASPCGIRGGKYLAGGRITIDAHLREILTDTGPGAARDLDFRISTGGCFPGAFNAATMIPCHVEISDGGRWYSGQRVRGRMARCWAQLRWRWRAASSPVAWSTVNNVYLVGIGEGIDRELDSAFHRGVPEVFNISNTNLSGYRRLPGFVGNRSVSWDTKMGYHAANRIATVRAAQHLRDDRRARIFGVAYDSMNNRWWCNS